MSDPETRPDSGLWSNLYRRLITPSTDAPNVIGVDILPWEIRVVRFERKRDGQFRLAQWGAQPIDPLWGLDSPALVRALRDAIKAVANGVTTADVWSSPVTDRVRMHHLELPRMKAEQKTQAVYWALQREESFAPADSVVDFAVEVPADATRLEALTAYLMPKEDRDMLARLFRQAGYPLAGLVLPLHAQRHLRQATGGAPSGLFAHVYAGTQGARVSVQDGARAVLTRSIPGGVEPLVDALLEGLQPVPPRGAALRMVQELGRPDWAHAPYTEDEVFQVIRPVLERFVRQVDRTLDYHRIQHGGEAVGLVYLAGPLVGSPRIRGFIEAQLPASVVVLDPFDLAAEGTTPPERPEERCLYAVAAGYALSGRASEPNFLRPFQDRQQERIFHRLSLMVFVAFTLLAVLLGSMYVQQRQQLADLREEHQRLAAEVQARRPIAEPEFVLARAANLSAEKRRLIEHLNRRMPAAILEELGRLTPPTIRLESVSAQLAGSPDSADTRPWVRLTGAVVGTADFHETELSLYLRSLQGSPLFGVGEIRSRSTVRRGAGQELDFALEVQLNLPTK